MGESKRRKALDPNYGLSKLLSDEEVDTIIKMLVTQHQEITEEMVSIAAKELAGYKLNGELFNLAMSGELDFRLNHRKKLEFGKIN